MTIKKRFYQMMSPIHPTDLVRPASFEASIDPTIHAQKSDRQRQSFSLVSKDEIESTKFEAGHPSMHGSPTDYYIVLVDIRKTIEKRRIECVKKLLAEPGLRYCAISYRWGEVPEQAIVTPDYIAHVTSFSISDLELLCGQLMVWNDFEKNGQKNAVDYVWVDAISIDQQNEKARKTTIRYMNEIYQHSTLILAVPDLHLGYLKQNPSVKATLAKIRKNTPQIYHHVTGACQPPKHLSRHYRPRPVPIQPSLHHQTYDFPHVSTMIHSSFSSDDADSSPLLTPITPDESNENVLTAKTALCECYGNQTCIPAIEFLDYLVMEWSNRAWVISEYHIGRTKTMRLWFLAFDRQWFYTSRPRFIPLFDCFYRDHFRHRKFLDMILNSRATRNEDRFYAILPLSIHYKHHIQTQDTVSLWQISDMTSVCLRLYEFVGLVEKLAILFCCSKASNLFLPSFASRYSNGKNAIAKIMALDPTRLWVQNITLINKDTSLDMPCSYQDRRFLALKTTLHRVLTTTLDRDTRVFWDNHAAICKTLEWKKSDLLDQVFVSFVESDTPLGIHLVGNRGVNRWVVYQLSIINVHVPACEWQLVDKVETFHIY